VNPDGEDDSKYVYHLGLKTQSKSFESGMHRERNHQNVGSGVAALLFRFDNLVHVSIFNNLNLAKFHFFLVLK